MNHRPDDRRRAGTGQVAHVDARAGDLEILEVLDLGDLFRKKHLVGIDHREAGEENLVILEPGVLHLGELVRQLIDGARQKHRIGCYERRDIGNGLHGDLVLMEHAGHDTDIAKAFLHAGHDMADLDDLAGERLVPANLVLARFGQPLVHFRNKIAEKCFYLQRFRRIAVDRCQADGFLCKRRGV